MKKLICIFICTWLTISCYSQNWVQGVPVNMQIVDLPESVFVDAFCDTMSGQSAQFHIPLPIVTGIEYYLHVDFSSPDTNKYKFVHGGIERVLGLNDSTLISPVHTIEIIRVGYAGYEGEVSFRIKAIGTPLVSGESHPCGSLDNGWINQPIACYFPFYVNMETYLTNCIVQLPTDINEVVGCRTRVFVANGQRNLTVIACQGAESEYAILDASGRSVLKGRITDKEMNVNLNEVIPGVYFYCEESKNGKGKFIAKFLIK